MVFQDLSPIKWTNFVIGLPGLRCFRTMAVQESLPNLETWCSLLLFWFIHILVQIEKRMYYNCYESYIQTFYFTFYNLFCASKYEEKKKKKTTKLLNIVPHLPPSLSLTSVSISSVKRNLLVHTIWECIGTASLYSMYVCVSLSIATS